MRTTLYGAAAAALLLASPTLVAAQSVDPDITGPARRAAGAAGEAIGAPGVEDRIEMRQQRRDLRRAAEGNPNAAERVQDRRTAGPVTDNRWRYRYHNNEWWYYMPNNTWQYYRGDRWSPYDQATYQPLPRRYTSGYRGSFRSRFDNAGQPGPVRGELAAPGTVAAPGAVPPRVDVDPNRGTVDVQTGRGGVDVNTNTGAVQTDPATPNANPNLNPDPNRPIGSPPGTQPNTNPVIPDTRPVVPDTQPVTPTNPAPATP